MKKFRNVCHKALSFLLAGIMMIGSITFPQAAPQLDESIPFEYGSGALNSLNNATVIGGTSGFTFKSHPGYAILSTEKNAQTYVSFKDAGTYIDANGKNKTIDMRLYVWDYQENSDASVATKSKMFMYFDNNILNISSFKTGDESDYNNQYGKDLHKNAGNSNGGVYMEYHFYESGTENEIPFKGVLTFNDLDGIGEEYVNEGISFTGGKVTVVPNSSSTIQETSRNGMTWYQGTKRTEDIANDSASSQKLTIKFESTIDNPLQVIYRGNTVNGDTTQSYSHKFTNDTVNINYNIPSSWLPSESTNKSSKTLIEEGGGEVKRSISFGTATNTSDAQAILSKSAATVSGYTFDGWYDNDQFAGNKWTGTNQITQSMILYGRYVKNAHTVTLQCFDIDTGAQLGQTMSKQFNFSDKIETITPVISITNSNNKSYQVVKVNVDGTDNLSVNPVGSDVPNVHYAKGPDRDVAIKYYYKLTNNEGNVEVQHIIESTGEFLDGGKYNTTYTGEIDTQCHVSPVTVNGWKVTAVQLGDGDKTSSLTSTPTYTNPATVIKFYYVQDPDAAGLTIKYVYEGEPEVPVTTSTNNESGKVGEIINTDDVRIKKQEADLDSAFTGLEFLGVKKYADDGTYTIVKAGSAEYDALTKITLSTQPQTVTFVYKVQGTDIVVRHISHDSCDSGYKILKQEEKVRARIGDVFTASPTNFAGYEYIGNDGKTPYTVTSADNNKTILIDFYYQHETHKLTVHHKDENGKTFVYKNDDGTSTTYNDVVINDIHYGKQWTAEQKPHFGYDVTPDVQKGTMGNEDVEVTYVYTPKHANVIVHYMTRDNGKAQTVIPDKQYDNWNYGDNYTVYADNNLSEQEQTELSHWTLVSPQNGIINGKINRFDAPIEVTFWYTKADASVTVRHIWVNENGQKEDITSPELITGKFGDVWESHPWSGADKAGFVCVQEPTIKAGEMKEPKLEIEYVYEKKDGKITINYLTRDNSGNLVEFGLVQTNMDVKFGDYIQTTPKLYPEYQQAYGYNVTSVTSDAKGWSQVKEDGTVKSYNGTVNQSSITINYIYEPIGVKVTTSYKHISGADIMGPDANNANDWIQNYTAHSKYTTHNSDNLPPTFYGYEWTGKYPLNSQGQLGAEDVFVTYSYVLKSSGAIVHYVDEDGNKLANDKTLTGFVFDSYEEYPISINGYDYKGLAKDSAPVKGQFTENNEDGSFATEITFVYKRAAASVVVRYVDTEGNRLHDPKTLNGNYGNPFNTSPEAIDGWTLVSIESTGNVTINESNTVSGHYDTMVQTVKFIYTRTATKVVVNHVDEETKLSLATQNVIEGNVNDNYEAKPVSLLGYSYVGIADGSAPISGKMVDGVLVVTLMYRRNAATVTVHFVDNISGDAITQDKNGNTITNPVIINGKFKDSYQTEPAEIYGWKLVMSPENKSGNMIDGNIDVVYRYEEYIPTVRVKYIDIDDGHEVSDSLRITGATGTRYETIAKDYDKEPNKYPELYGYELVEIPDNANGKFGETDITVTYKYQKKTRTLTVLFVEYVDGEQIEIAPAETKANLVVGDWYKTNAKTVPGYELISIPDNAKGYITEKPITVIYVYQKASAIVKVRFVNESLADIATSETITGNIGDKYTTTPKEIAGYQLITTPSNWKGTIDQKEIFVTYVYKVATATVTTRYIDADTGENLTNNVIRTYPWGSEYTTTAKEFEGYHLVETPSNATGIANNPNGEVVDYYYSMREAFVTARYIAVDKLGNEKQIAKPVVQTGKVGGEYTTFSKDIDGYVLDHVDGNTQGKLVAGNTIVTYYYTAVPAKVVVQYVDMNGASIANEEVIEGHVGDVYDTVQKTIEGYDFKSVTDNKSGTMKEGTTYVVYTYSAKDATIIVKYVNEKETEIAESEHFTCRRNATYQTEAKEIYGYTLKDTPANAFGNADADVITVTYVYITKDATVNVKFIDDKTEKEIAEVQTIIGKVFDEYKTKAAEVDGYTLITTPANASGKMTVEPITVVYRYSSNQQVEPAKDAKVIVKYVDADGKPIADNSVITGKVGDTYTTEAKKIDGYTLTKTPDNASGKMAETEIEVTYVYEKDKYPAKITVKFVDKDGKDIIPSESKTGNVGDKYETIAKTIPGYKLVKTPENAKGVLTKEEIVVSYEYEKLVETKVVVKYVDKDGKEITPSEIINGYVDDDYEAKAKEVKGYKLTKTPENAKGKMTKDTIEVNFVYELEVVTPENGTVLVKYVDENGKAISTTTVIKGKIGSDYEAKAKTIDGYELVKTPDNAKGKIEKNVTVVFTYKAIKKDVKVTVIYKENIDGKEIADRTVINLKSGDKYETTAKEISGYVLYTTPSNAKGIILDKDLTVTYLYRKDVPANASINVTKVATTNGTTTTSSMTLGKAITYKIVVSATNGDATNVVITDQFEDVYMSAETATVVYVIDTSKKEIHSSKCQHLDSIATTNRKRTTQAYSTLVKAGYKEASDCTPSKDANSSAYWKTPNVTIYETSAKVVDQNGKKLSSNLVKFENGKMIVTIDKIAKGNSVTITYDAYTSDQDLIDKNVVNNVTVKADNATSRNTSATVTVKGTGNNNNQVTIKPDNKPNNNQTPSNTQKPNNGTTNIVQTGDTYVIIFGLFVGVIVLGSLAYILLKKKK